jgi:hypothetical protein
MRPNWGRVARNAACSGISLAIIGYLLGRTFLMAHRSFGGGAEVPDSNRVLWQTPLVMAGLGVALTVGLDVMMQLVRRPVPVPVTDTPPAP